MTQYKRLACIIENNIITIMKSYDVVKYFNLTLRDDWHLTIWSGREFHNEMMSMKNDDL